MSKKLITVSLLALLLVVPLTARGQATKPFSEMTDAELEAHLAHIRAERWTALLPLRLELQKHTGAYIGQGPNGVAVVRRTFPNLVRAILEANAGLTQVWDASEVGAATGKGGAKGAAAKCAADIRECGAMLWKGVSALDDWIEAGIRTDLMNRYPPEQYPDITAADIDNMVELISETKGRLIAERKSAYDAWLFSIYNECEARAESEKRLANREQRRKEMEERAEKTTHRGNGIPDVGGEDKVIGKPFPGTGKGTSWWNRSDWDEEDLELDDEITVCGNCPSEVTVSGPQAPTNTRLRKRGSE